MFDLSGNLLFSVHSGGDGGGMAGMLDIFLSAIEHLTSLPPGEMFAEMLPGIAAMENIHPLFVHYPIAFLTAFFLIDLTASLMHKADWRRIAGWFLYLGAIFAGFTVLAGLSAASSVPHGEEVHEIMEAHEHLGITVFSLAAGLSVWRLIGKPALQGVANYIYLILAGCLCVLLALGADLGGLMVYKHGVAVEAARPAHVDSLSEHQHEHSH